MMLSQTYKNLRYAAVGFFAVALFSVSSAPWAIAAVEPTEPAGRTPLVSKRATNLIEYAVGNCSPMGQVLRESKPTNDPLAPLASLCVNGTLNPADPDINRPGVQTTGSGIQGPCTGSAVVDYDAYSFNLTGCAAFPTEVTMTLCGPAGCLPVATTDTNLYLYRNVAAGDPLTANGGLPAAFDPANSCTNVRAGNSNLNGGAASNPGTGNTCNQVNTANCLGSCAANTNAAGFRRQLGNGRFTVVVTGVGPADTGGYNLYVDAPAAGCSVALAPSAANGGISGRVITAGGRGVGMTTVTISGGALAQPITALTNAFGYYTVSNLEAGFTYSVSVSAKGMTFNEPVRVVTVQDEGLAGIDFIAN